MTSAFEAEQRALAGACWQLVGIGDDLAHDDAWIRRSVFGTDAFVQRFEGELRGFHNVCAHRGFPLRQAPAGVGPVRCGLHGWGYNKDGVPTTVPRNAELFELTRDRRIELALPAIRVEAIGRFVFATRGAGPTLAGYLGPYASVLRAIDATLGDVILRQSVELAADWKLHAEISHDDYHLGAIHATTFGAGEPPPLHQFVYRRDGRHSCYLKRRDPDWSFDGFWRDVEAGAFDHTGYKIFNCFPSTIVATTREVCVASATQAIAPGRCRLDSYLFTWRSAPPAPEAVAPLVEYFATVFREDGEACEAWQRGAPRPSVFGALEERIGWFRDSYAAITGRA